MKKPKLLIFLVFGIITVISGVAFLQLKRRNWGTKPDSATNQSSVASIIVGDAYKQQKNDSYQIENVSIDGNILKINVSYGGGCGEHTFSLFWDKMVAKSLPGQSTLYLIHNAHEERCEAFLHNSLKFDLSTLSSSTSFQLSNGTEVIFPKWIGIDANGDAKIQDSWLK